VQCAVSDWIGEAPLLRIDPVHHRVALFPSKRSGVQHINHQVESIDDIMRSYYFLREKNVRIRFGPGRHPTSGAMFLYFEGPDGMIYEYSSGVRMITDEDYIPRSFQPPTRRSALGVRCRTSRNLKPGNRQCLNRPQSVQQRRAFCGAPHAPWRAPDWFTPMAICSLRIDATHFIVTPPKPLVW